MILKFLLNKLPRLEKAGFSLISFQPLCHQLVGKLETLLCLHLRFEKAGFWQSGYRKNKREFIILLIVLGILWFNCRRVFPPLVKDMVYIKNRLIQNPNYSYDEKMKEKVGEDYYDWTKLVREHTTKDSKVMHPPQMWPWGQSGNPEFSQYFLHPAKLIRENRKKLLGPNDITHLLISGEQGGGFNDNRYFGWPKFPVFAKKIYYLPQARKIEINGLTNLKEWQKDAERVINFTDGRVFDLTYTSSTFDYWVEPRNLVLSPSTKLTVSVKSNWLESVALIAKVSFGNNKFAVFASSPNKKTDEWENLNLENLYSRAFQLAKLRGWPVQPLKVEALGLDTGHPAPMPYLYQWGLIELEKGGKDRLNFLEQQVVNSQTLLSLGNIYSLEKKQDSAYDYYYQASLLESANPWTNFGMAETARKMGRQNIAEQEYKRAVELGGEISWFSYALGDFYQEKEDFEKAIKEYQKSLSLNPLSFWSYRALGEIYEAQDRLDLAYKNYSLASAEAGRDFTYDGKVAWDNLQKIKEEQNEVIKQSLIQLDLDPQDWRARLSLARAYAAIGEAEKAKEQYELVYEINPSEEEVGGQDFPPKIVDQLNEPIYGTKGPAVEDCVLEDKSVALLDNYHSFLMFEGAFFPASKGTIEILWKPPEDLNHNKVPRNLIYQFRGVWVWVSAEKLNFALFDKKTNQWQIISGLPQLWDINKWYQIAIGYGQKGMSLFLNGQRINKNSFYGGIDNKKDVFLGRGPLWSVVEKPYFSGYFETIKIYDYQKMTWE